MFSLNCIWRSDSIGQIEWTRMQGSAIQINCQWFINEVLWCRFINERNRYYRLDEIVTRYGVDGGTASTGASIATGAEASQTAGVAAKYGPCVSATIVLAAVIHQRVALKYRLSLLL